MSLDNISAEDLACTDTAIVRALGSWKTHLGPAIWPAVRAKYGILLLQPKPWLVLGIGLHQPHALMTIVELVGGSVRVPGLRHHKDVVATSERIGEDGNRADIDIGIVARSLTGG